MKPYINDIEFLKNICSQKERQLYAQITALTLDDTPLEVITGKVTGGSVNIDGASAVRRTCSLSIIVSYRNNKIIAAEELNTQYWGLNTKFELEIGIKNSLQQYKNYPIIWFSMGQFLIASFTSSFSRTGVTINLQGKDKMCQLNGEMGGTFQAQTNFGVIDEYDYAGMKTVKQIPVKQVIRDLIHTYSNEQYNKICIEDVDTYGLAVESYRGNVPMYFFLSANNLGNDESPTPLNYMLDGEFEVVDENDDVIKLKDIADSAFYQTGFYSDVYHGELFHLKQNKYKTIEFYIRKIEYGDTVGYKLTEVTYPGDLIGNAGETVTSILDKIKKMLGDFEYFYDVDGTFVFRKQRAYKETNYKIKSTSKRIVKPTETQEENSEEEFEKLSITGGNYIITDYDDRIDFTFDNLELINSINNNPAVGNIKNDFTVWGNRPGPNGKSSTPIHMRYALDSKPISYVTIYIDEERAKTLLDYYPQYFSLRKGESREEAIQRMILEHPKIYYHSYEVPSPWADSIDVDWRELIYQMAKDFRQFNQVDEFPIWLMKDNDWIKDGKTGYEQYYTDLEGFWRTIYSPVGQSFKWYDSLIDGQEYIINYKTKSSGTAKKTSQTYLFNVSKIKKDNTIIPNYTLYIKNKNGEYSNIGSLYSIIQTNYNILQRHIERIVLDTYRKVDENLFNKIAQNYSSAGIQNYLFFKDPRTLMYNGGTEMVLATKPEYQYQEFQYPYIRLSETPNSVTGKFEWYGTCMSSDLNNRVKVDSTDPNTELNLIRQVFYLLGDDTTKNAPTNGSVFTKVRNTLTQTETVEHELYYKNISTLCHNVEDNYFEWFVKLSDDSYSSLGKYYPLNGMDDKIYIYTGTNKASKDLSDDDMTTFDVLYEKSLSEILEENHMYFQQITKIGDWRTLAYSDPKAAGWLVVEDTLDDLFNNGAVFDYNQALFYFKILGFEFENLINFQEDTFNAAGWNKNIFNSPENLDFWLDFLDSQGEISKYSIPVIGQRPKVTNDSGVKVIKYQNIMKNIFLDSTDELTNTNEKIQNYFNSDDYKSDYNYYNVGIKFSSFLSPAAQGKDACSVIANQLYDYIQQINSISISCIPLFFLQPNTKFNIYNSETNINGTYILNKLSFNLTHNTTMNLTAIQTIENNIVRGEIYQ